jgi:uncharacterized protein YfaA (DUF2138 family)
MKNDAMLVEPQMIACVRNSLAEQGAQAALQALAKSEPALAMFVAESLAATAGRLALSGAPTGVVQGVHEDVLETVLTSVESIKRAHFELWKDTELGARLKALAAAPERKHKVTRKRRVQRDSSASQRKDQDAS